MKTRHFRKSAIRSLAALLPVLILASFALPTYAGTQKLTAKQLKDKVLAELARYYEEEFDVSATDDGEVTIRGTVHTYYDKLRIFDIVSKIQGVKKIRNLVAIDTEPIPDKTIEAKIVQELHLAHSILEPDRIKVKVNNGIVFLSGEVSFYREKLEAQTLASWQEGVKGVVNEIKVLPPHKAVSDDNLRFILREVLKNQFPSVEKEVKFTVKNGVVTLTGRVHTIWQRSKIEEEFSRIRGVRKVINNLKIEPYF